MKILQGIIIILTTTLLFFSVIDTLTELDQAKNQPCVQSNKYENNPFLKKYLKGDPCSTEEKIKVQSTLSNIAIKKGALVGGSILGAGIFLFIALGKFSSPRKTTHKSEVTA